MSVNSIEVEQSLLERLLLRSAPEKEKAWELVYKTYYPMIRDYIHKNSGGDADATDIFQDGLVILHRNLNNGTFRQEASIKTYIYGICRNLWLKELEKKKKRALTKQELMAVEPEEDDVNHLLNVEVVSLLINELKEDCRNILVEYYYNNKSMAELKEMFSVNSIQAAKNKKWRCMGYLVNLFKEKGYRT